MSNAGDHKDDPRGGETRARVKGCPAPRLPHERDESSDSVATEPSQVMQQAHADVQSGKTGSDRGEATDEVYRRTLRDNTPGRERDAKPGKA